MTLNPYSTHASSEPNEQNANSLTCYWPYCATRGTV